MPTDSTSRSHVLGGIIIQEDRLQIPFSKQNHDLVVLDGSVIQSLPIHSVGEILTYVAGVDIRQRGPWGGQADVSIDGGTFDQTLVLLNGVKIVDPQTGHNMLNLPINPQDIDRIEILKGAAASAYGINALAGAINIVTKNPGENSLSVQMISGSNLTRDTATNKVYGGLEIGISGSLKRKNTRHYFSFSTEQSSGYRYNTALNNDKVYYQNEIAVGKQSFLQMMAGLVYNKFGANGFYAAPADVESQESLTTAIAAVKGDFQVTKNWTIRPSFSYRFNHDDYIFVRQNPALYENLHTTDAFDFSLNNSIKTGFGSFGIGMEYRKDLIRSNSLGDRGRGNLGWFAEYVYAPFRNFDFHLGSYLNYSPLFGWQLLPSFDLGYQLTENWRLYSSIGTGIRVPTFTDWYYVGPDNVGNPDLIPERSFNGSIGIKYNGHKLTASGSYFYRYTHNFIDWVKNDLSDPWQPENFQNIKMPGISLSADYRLLDQAATGGFNVLAGLSYTWLHPSIDLNETVHYTYSNYALENLNHQLVLRLNTKYGAHMGFTVTGRYESRANYISYFLLDAGITGNFGRFEIRIFANNLTNQTYIEAGAVPMPGRWLNLGVNWKLF